MHECGEAINRSAFFVEVCPMNAVQSEFRLEGEDLGSVAVVVIVVAVPGLGYRRSGFKCGPGFGVWVCSAGAVLGFKESPAVRQTK